MSREFWRWLFLGLNFAPGYKQFKAGWVVLHLVVGALVAAVVQIPVSESARAILLPLAGIFIGLSFSWIGNAQALLQSEEIEALAKQHKDGIRSYVYTFQLAVLVVLITLAVWSLGGLKVFDSIACHSRSWAFAIEAVMYSLVGLTLHESWHVVMGSQKLLLVRHEVRSALRQASHARGGTDGASQGAQSDVKRKDTEGG